MSQNMDPIKIDKFYLKCFGHEDYLRAKKSKCLPSIYTFATIDLYL